MTPKHALSQCLALSLNIKQAYGGEAGVLSMTSIFNLGEAHMTLARGDDASRRRGASSPANPDGSGGSPRAATIGGPACLPAQAFSSSFRLALPFWALHKFIYSAKLFG